MKAHNEVGGDNKAKRILFIESGVGLGGSSKYLVDLFKYLDRNRYEPLLASYVKGLNFEAVESAGVRTFTLGLGVLTDDDKRSRLKKWIDLALWFFVTVFPGIFKIASLIRRERIDAIHLNNEILSHLPGLIAGKLTSTTTVVHFQGHRKLTFLERTFGKLATAYIALSESGARLFAEQLNRTVYPLHHAVDLENYDPEKYARATDLRERFPGCRLVGLVGRVMPWKGQDVFIKSAVKAVEEFPDLRLLIIGDDPAPGKPFRKAMEVLAKEKGIADNVVFMGWQRDIPAKLAQLDIFVHASVRPEPFGIVIIEAMAMKKPVIATDAGGVPEIVVLGETGYLTPIGDTGTMEEALLKLLRDPEGAMRMGEKGRKRVEQFFDIRLNASRLQEFYDSLMERAG